MITHRFVCPNTVLDIGISAFYSVVNILVVAFEAPIQVNSISIHALPIDRVDLVGRRAGVGVGVLVARGEMAQGDVFRRK